MSTRYKLGLPAAIMALAISSTAFADRDDGRRDRSGDCSPMVVEEGGGYCCPEEVCAPCARIEMIPTIKPNCCEGPALCHAYPTCIECYNMNVDIGFLYEQMRMTRTDFAFTTNSLPGVLPKSAYLLRPTFKLDWGLTASVGYFLEHDSWFFEITFDWLRSKGRRNGGCNWNQFIEPINIWKAGLLNGADFTLATQATDRFKVNYFMLQFDVARASYLSTFLAIEPHMGMRVTWFHYDNKVRFTGGSELGNNIVYHNQKTHFWGLGPEWGVNSKWGLCQGFYLYMDDTIGILFGETRDKDFLRLGIDCGCSSNTTFATQHFQVMSPFLQAVIGFGFDRCMCNNTQSFTVKAGLDTTHYWNQWNHIDVINERENGGPIPTFHSVDDAEVSLIGLRVEVAWAF